MPTRLEPGPDHPIHITAAPGRVRAHFDGRAIADSDDVLMLKEADYPAVAYFPRDAVEMSYMGKTDKVTHCPYKGDASYWTLRYDGKIAENALWSYEDPYPAMEAIRGRIAFYANVFEISTEPDATSANAVDPGEVIRHTDSGAGSSQAQPWPPNTTEPVGSGPS